MVSYFYQRVRASISHFHLVGVALYLCLGEEVEGEPGDSSSDHVG